MKLGNNIQGALVDEVLPAMSEMLAGAWPVVLAWQLIAPPGAVEGHLEDAVVDPLN